MRLVSVIIILVVIAGAIFIPQVFFKVDETAYDSAAYDSAGDNLQTHTADMRGHS